MTPMKFAAVSMVLNIVIGAAAFFWIREFAPDRGHVGLAAATSFAGWINAGLLAIFLARRGALDPDRRLKRALARLLIATALAGGVMYALTLYSGILTEWLLGSRLLTAVVASGTGLVAYGFFAMITGGLRISELRHAFARG